MYLDENTLALVLADGEVCALRFQQIGNDFVVDLQEGCAHEELHPGVHTVLNDCDSTPCQIRPTARSQEIKEV